MIIGYQLGFRLKPVAKPYETPYMDLPPFYSGGFTSPLAAKYVCYTLLEGMRRGFPGAEWRLVELRADYKGHSQHEFETVCYTERGE